MTTKSLLTHPGRGGTIIERQTISQTDFGPMDRSRTIIEAYVRTQSISADTKNSAQIRHSFAYGFLLGCGFLRLASINTIGSLARGIGNGPKVFPEMFWLRDFARSRCGLFREMRASLNRRADAETRAS